MQKYHLILPSKYNLYLFNWKNNSDLHNKSFMIFLNFTQVYIYVVVALEAGNFN